MRSIIITIIIVLAFAFVACISDEPAAYYPDGDGYIFLEKGKKVKANTNVDPFFLFSAMDNNNHWVRDYYFMYDQSKIYGVEYNNAELWDESQLIECFFNTQVVLFPNDKYRSYLILQFDSKFLCEGDSLNPDPRYSGVQPYFVVSLDKTDKLNRLVVDYPLLGSQYYDYIEGKNNINPALTGKFLRMVFSLKKDVKFQNHKS